MAKVTVASDEGATSTAKSDHEPFELKPLTRFSDQILVIARGLARAPERSTLVWLSTAVFAVILLTAVSQVALNAWNSPFYNAIQARNFGFFLHELFVFFGIAGSLLVLNVVQMWLNLMIQLKLRAGLMHNLLDLWLRPLRAFKLAHAGSLGVNPDQRLHEDTRHLAELSTNLSIGLLQASVLLVVFVVVLWHLSTGFALDVAGHTVKIPGYMVWAAVVYALIGSFASYGVGHSLIRLNAERYGREAELRYVLVRVSDYVGTIALQRGEASERRMLEIDLGNVLDAMRKLVTATTNLTWVTAGYGWLTQVVPILVAAPVYFSGHISFGGLMMAVGAFNQVQAALRWFVDNFGTIADWRATLLRVADFRHAVLAVAKLHHVVEKIEVDSGLPGHLILENLAVASQGNCIKLDYPFADIKAGERVQITGDSGDDQTVFFRALAGLWPWGEGRIRLPANEPFMHIARRPYVRPGRLRDVLAYPRDPADFRPQWFAEALEAVGLAEFVPRLDEDGRWDKELGDQDMQKLAFARLPLQRPAWIVIDQALETLDDKAREQIITMFETVLKSASIINIGRANPADTLFTRTFSLVKDPEGCRLMDEWQWDVTPTATERTPAVV